jgi:arginase
VIGGDCSVLLGNMLALRSRGKYGLLFIDGHNDFQTPEQSASKGVAGGLAL